MVHKKSEHRRAFRWKSPEECHAIWEENCAIRQRLKLQEYRHVPFTWENGDNGSDDEESVTELPPSKLHLKYLELKQLESTKKTSGTETKCSPKKTYTDKEVQTPPWNAQKNHHSQHVSPEKAVQTDITLPSSVCRNLQDDFGSSASEPLESTSLGHESKPLQNQPFKSTGPTSPHRTSRPRHSKTQAGVKPSSPRRHRSPFVSYGWADKTIEMGMKRTFNVNASKNVYPSAIQAQQHKRHSTKLGKAASRVHNPEEHGKLSSTYTKGKECDVSWMSEYKQSYCRASK